MMMQIFFEPGILKIIYKLLKFNAAISSKRLQLFLNENSIWKGNDT